MQNPLYLRSDGQKAKQNSAVYRRITVRFELPQKHKTEYGKRRIVSFCKSCLLMKQ